MHDRPSSAFVWRPSARKMERATGTRGDSPITVAPCFHPEATASGAGAKSDVRRACPYSDERSERCRSPSVTRGADLPSLAHVSPSTSLRDLRCAGRPARSEEHARRPYFIRDMPLEHAPPESRDRPRICESCAPPFPRCRHCRSNKRPCAASRTKVPSKASQGARMTKTLFASLFVCLVAIGSAACSSSDSSTPSSGGTS
jgi:hypothetical protein